MKHKKKSSKKFVMLFIASLITLAIIIWAYVNTQKILLVGFEPFGNHSTNSSKEALLTWEKDRSLISRIFYSVQVLIVPASTSEANKLIQKEIQNLNPKFIVMFGVNYKAHSVFIEHEAVGPGGDKKFPTLEINKLKADLNAAQIPVDISYNAGEFVCNEVFYETLRKNEQFKLKKQIGFVHLPDLAVNSFDKKLLGQTVDVVLSALH